MAKRSHSGIEVCHREHCGALKGKRCSCTPKYRAEIYSARERRRVYKVLPTLAAAKAWRADANVALRQGVLVSTPATLDDAARDWLACAAAGAIRNRSGDIYSVEPTCCRSLPAGSKPAINAAEKSRRLTASRNAYSPGGARSTR